MSRAHQINGIGLIAAERQRQIEFMDYDGYHDDSHVGGQIAKAAACLATPPGSRTRDLLERLWPRGWGRFKPSKDDRIDDLKKAGALCAAEIDRLLRKQDAKR